MANKKVVCRSGKEGVSKITSRSSGSWAEVKEMLAEAKEFLDADSMARGSEKVEKTETKIDLSRHVVSKLKI